MLASHETQVTAPPDLEPVIHRTLEVLNTWGIRPRKRICVVIGVDWYSTIKVHLNPLEQLWYTLNRSRDEAIWQKAAACCVHLMNLELIVLKPCEAQLDFGIAERLFVSRSDQERLEWTLCHEFTHACTGHLRLPFWLNEGVAMLATDAFAGRDTVRAETKAHLEPRRVPRQNMLGITRLTPDGWLALYAHSYWLSRAALEDRTGLFRRALERRQSHRWLLRSLISNG